MLKRAYDKMMRYADHPNALWVLMAVSFAESSFFPIPPDPLYIAMLVNRPKNAWKLATICTLASVVGGFLGYYIGYGLYETVGVWIVKSFGAEAGFQKMQDGFNEYGFWIVALKGLTPIPYKIVTIASGVAHLDLMTFFLASILARGFRFFSLALFLWYFPGTKDFIERNLTAVTIGGIVILIFGFVVIPYLF
jgi:membrane protein YqaA with SNARE-associated domain